MFPNAGDKFGKYQIDNLQYECVNIILLINKKRGVFLVKKACFSRCFSLRKEITFDCLLLFNYLLPYQDNSRTIILVHLGFIKLTVIKNKIK